MEQEMTVFLSIVFATGNSKENGFRLDFKFHYINII